MRNYRRLGKVGRDKPFLHVVRDVEILLSRNHSFNMGYATQDGKQKVFLQCDANKATTYLPEGLKWELKLYQDSRKVPTVVGRSENGEVKHFPAITFFQNDADYESRTTHCGSKSGDALVPVEDKPAGLQLSSNPLSTHVAAMPGMTGGTSSEEAAQPQVRA